MINYFILIDLEMTIQQEEISGGDTADLRIKRQQVCFFFINFLLRLALSVKPFCSSIIL